MNDEPSNKFREAEQVELVSEPASAEHVADEQNGRHFQSFKALRSNPAEASGASVTPTSGETLTPWTKRRKSASPKRHKVILMVAATVIVAPIVAVCTAVCSFPQGPPMVLLQAGMATGNRWMILKAFADGWHNAPEHVGVLITAANERAKVDKTAAIELYNDCVRFNPNFASAYMNRGRNYALLDKSDLAIADYDKALQLRPDYILAYNNRACLYENLHQYDKALNDFDRGIALAPGDGMLYYNRSRLYGLMNKHDLELNDLLRCERLGFIEASLDARISNARSHL